MKKKRLMIALDIADNESNSQSSFSIIDKERNVVLDSGNVTDTNPERFVDMLKERIGSDIEVCYCGMTPHKEDHPLEVKTIEDVISEVVKYNKLNTFVDNIVDTYEKYKHETFYTKGFIYDSNDRIISDGVLRSTFGGEYKLEIEGVGKIKISIPDRYMTKITFDVVEGKINIDVKSRGVLVPKIQKEAMRQLAISIFNKLC